MTFSLEITTAEEAEIQVHACISVEALPHIAESSK